MSRSARLLDLVEILRRHRNPVSGARLAEELGVSLRTLYRDIATLQAQGATIEGAAGVGYALRPGFLLPPLMFADPEIEALVLGMRWVAGRGDPALAEAARGALSKILEVLPSDLCGAAQSVPLLAGPEALDRDAAVRLGQIRAAIRRERKLLLSYADAAGKVSARQIWPFALGFFERVQVVVAWCELRGAFRHFRIDRIEALTALETRYPRGRARLLADWRQAEGIAPQ